MPVRHAVAALMLAACDRPPRSTAVPAAGHSDDAAHDIARIDADVRLEVALKRIATLEREVAELKAGPAAVDADLLRQQLVVTQDALADASRAGVTDVAVAASPADRAGSRAGSRAMPSASPPRDGGSARATAPSSSPPPAKPAARPTPRVTGRPSQSGRPSRPGLELDLR